MSLIDKHHEFDCPLDVRTVFDRIKSVAYDVPGLSFEFANEKEFVVALGTGISLFSWGENVTITCTGLNPNATRVHIKSAPCWPLTLVDFGTNRRHVFNVLSALKRVLPLQ